MNKVLHFICSGTTPVARQDAQTQDGLHLTTVAGTGETLQGEQVPQQA